MLGSSPRMRGKLRSRLLCAQERRLIPAYAGKTELIGTPDTAERAHPRVCGENLRASPQTTRGRGSSPRMRGKLPQRAGHVLNAGLIPAYAGKTPVSRAADVTSWAHPRVCGENAICDIDPVAQEGSSPRMRGKRSLFLWFMLGLGLIPAYAGKTVSRERRARNVWAHPRVCGENERSSSGQARPPGSSPRMRGKLRLPQLTASSSGLIPAYAGKTIGQMPRSCQCWAHPRVCGENTLFAKINAQNCGSSPRMRGKPARSR